MSRSIHIRVSRIGVSFLVVSREPEQRRYDRRTDEERKFEDGSRRASYTRSERLRGVGRGGETGERSDFFFLFAATPASRFHFCTSFSTL